MVGERDLQKAFSVTLRRLRTEKSISQEQLAVVSGVARSTIASFEVNDRSPSLLSFYRLAEGLELTQEELIEELNKDLSEIRNST